jgi:MFS family permease
VYEPPMARMPSVMGGSGLSIIIKLLIPFQQVLGLLRPILPILGLMVTVNFIQASISAFLPLFLVDVKELPMPIAATMVALISGAGIIGAPIGGTLSDKIGRKPVMILSVALIGPFVYSIAAAPVGDWLIPWLVVSTLLLGLSRSLAQPVLDSLLADTVPAELRATAFSLYFFANSEMGGLGVPILGSIIDRVGLSLTFTTFSLIIIGISGFAVLMRRRI